MVLSYGISGPGEDVVTDAEAKDLVPSSKLDLERAERTVEIGYPEIAPVLPQLLEWCRDMNWPVAQVLRPLLAGIGPIAGDVRSILTGDDLIWIQCILQDTVLPSSDLIALLGPEIKAVAALSGTRSRTTPPRSQGQCSACVSVQQVAEPVDLPLPVPIETASQLRRCRNATRSLIITRPCLPHAS